MNKLATEQSLYLRQHSKNPVDWYSWCEEAFKLAESKGLPIFLSIGYSSCHWCHVMERESFEDQNVANIMNSNFVSIKVDKEERPDLDSIYMAAVQTITGSGGWPLSIFLTPDLRPFFGGTYFPPQDRHGLPSFSNVLLSVANAWNSKRQEIYQNAEHLKRLVRDNIGYHRTGTDEWSKEMIFPLAVQISSKIDIKYGGFKGFPKFPQVPLFSFLLTSYSYKNDERFLKAVTLTLDGMANGGIQDHIGGGFHRYSTDEKWCVPHFEKMLYDNALIAKLYTTAYQITNNNKYKQIAEKTLDFILKEMSFYKSGFISSIDADTDGVEGDTYTWSYQELKTLLSDEQFKIASKHWSISNVGNYEGKNVLNVLFRFESINGADQQKNDVHQIKNVYKILQKVRNQRLQPKKDKKMIVGWIALVVQALSEYGTNFNKQSWTLHGEQVVENIFRYFDDEDDRFLPHIIGDDSDSRGTDITGFLSDYSELALACFCLYQNTLKEKWLSRFMDLSTTIIDKFWNDDDGVFYDTFQTENLYMIPNDTLDTALYSGPSSATLVTLYMYSLTGEARLINIMDRSIANNSKNMRNYPSASGRWLSTVLTAEHIQQIVLVGDRTDEKLQQMVKIANNGFYPGRIIIQVNKPVRWLPVTKNKVNINGKPTAYICKNFVCEFPVTSIGEFETLINS